MPEFPLTEMAIEAVKAYLTSKAVVFDGDPDLATLTITLRVSKRGGQRTIGRIFHRTDSEGADVIPSAAPARA